MKRYCKKCQCEYDFQIKSMTDLDNLICPVCGNKIDKESRAPREIDQAEQIIASGLSWYYTARYYFFMFFAILGIALYFLEIEKGVYAVTRIWLVTYLLRNRRFFRSFSVCIACMVASSALSYKYIDRSLQGICLGILVVFAIRHMLKAFGYKLLAKFIRLGNS